MSTSELSFDLTLDEFDADAERLNDLTIHLMRELRDLGGLSVERPAGAGLPVGAKGDPVTWGALALATVPTVIPKLVEFLQSWVFRGENRKVRIKTPTGLEIEFTPEKKLSKDAYLSLVKMLTETKDLNLETELLQTQNLGEETATEEKSNRIEDENLETDVEQAPSMVAEASTDKVLSEIKDQDPETEIEIEKGMDEESLSNRFE